MGRPRVRPAAVCTIAGVTNLASKFGSANLAINGASARAGTPDKHLSLPGRDDEFDECPTRDAIG